MSIRDIVNVQITRQTASLSRAGFGTMLLLTPKANISSRLAYATSPAEAATLLLGGSSAVEYDAVVKLFSQNPCPTRIAIGYQQSVKNVTFIGLTGSGTIKVTVNGVLITRVWGVDKATTLSALASDIAMNVNIASAVYTAGTSIMVITPAVGKQVSLVFDLSAVVGISLTFTSTPSETITQALDAITDYNDDWYALAISSRTSADQLLAAAWVETRRKVCGFASSEPNIVTQAVSADTTSIAALLVAGAYTRSFVMFHDDASIIFPEVALFGRVLPLDPGTYTTKFKTLAGVPVSKLTTTQSTNARAKKCQTYEEVGGANIVQEGTMGSGEWIDIIIFVDWLHARLTEGVYRTLYVNDKLPYTATGIACIRSAIDQVLRTGMDRGGISPMAFDSNKLQIGGYYIVTPLLENVSVVDKAARYLQGVKFTAFLAGAVHAVKIDGVVTY